MHVAGRFARHLYPYLKKVVKDVPSANYVEELLRVTALVHDIGHGPFATSSTTTISTAFTSLTKSWADHYP